ncbi:hypothetical protein DFH11DRAFT_891001 [Phellopilus nigrolimitatus]|nr:hypothetical protein DFH11DRAFT_891001 [Phellopilus nigrolimitatus]
MRFVGKIMYVFGSVRILFLSSSGSVWPSMLFTYLFPTPRIKMPFSFVHEGHGEPFSIQKHHFELRCSVESARISINTRRISCIISDCRASNNDADVTSFFCSSMSASRMLFTSKVPSEVPIKRKCLKDPIRAFVHYMALFSINTSGVAELSRYVSRVDFSKPLVEPIYTLITMHSIRSDVEPVDPSLVPLIISDINIGLYAQVAILTLLVYDTITTMDKEVKYFWSTPRKIVSLVYFANRYIGILGSLSGTVHFTLQADETLCKRPDAAFHSLLIIFKGLGFTWLQDLANWITILLIDYILLMRVLALYHQDERLAACLRTLIGLEAAFGLGLLIYDIIYQGIAEGELAKGVTICGENRAPPKVWSALSWAAPMLYAVILMVLALYKAAEHWRETAGFSHFTLVKVLIQDQAIYFIMVIFCSVMETISVQLDVTNAVLGDLLSILGSPSLLCILGSHLLVHLKEAGERGVNGGTSYRMKTMSSIGFS